MIDANSVNEGIVSDLDFSQTFRDVAGAELPSDMQGCSHSGHATFLD